MVEKKENESDPRHQLSRAIEKKFSPLFSNAKTRESRDLQQAENCKKTVNKEEGTKLSLDFDATY